MIDEGFNVLVKPCELGRVLHVLEVLDLLVRDRVGADGDIAAAWRISWRRAMLSFVAEGPTYDTGSCEVPSGYQVGKLLGLPNPLSLLLYMCGTVLTTVRPNETELEQEQQTLRSFHLRNRANFVQISQGSSTPCITHNSVYGPLSGMCESHSIIWQASCIALRGVCPTGPARNDVKKLRFGRSSPLQSPTGGTSAPGACNICGTAQALCQS